MQSLHYKLTEFFFIFIVVPISFVLDFSVWLKAVIGILGFTYILIILLKTERKPFKLSKTIVWQTFWKQTSIKLALIALLTVVMVYVTNKNLLFSVVLNKPLLWLSILFFYSVFSVYPQELIYRTFYFKRYKNLFKNEKLFIFINAVVFALAHLFFRSPLVLLFTFCGGLLFAITYQKTNSTFLVSVEHAIYGCWLFTVGMGDMLGFPS